MSDPPQSTRYINSAPAVQRLFAGALTGVDFPGDIAALLAAGPRFLTKAFRATGVMAANNEVLAITNATEFFGGGLGGTKLSLDVSYLHPAPHLNNQLFVKFQIPLGHPWRDKFAPVMEPEIRFALLSLSSDFPIRVASCYFADYHPLSQSAVLITERIAYGQDGIEPARDKCLDYLLDDPLGHYRALVRALAGLAAFHKTGGFGEEVERQFPFDAEAQCAIRLIRCSPARLKDNIKKLRVFITQMPQLFMDALRSSKFLNEFDRTAMLVQRNEGEITAYLTAQREMIALCHWNLNIDNAWFWRDASRQLDCGVLDWGGVAQMNIAHSFFGMVSAADPAFLAAHEESLMAYFLEQYRLHGGPTVDPVVFERCVRLATAVKGIAWMLDGFLEICPDLLALGDVKDCRDGRINDTFKLRAAVQMFMTFFTSWQRSNMGRVLESFGV